MHRHRIGSIKRIGDYLLARGVAPADLLRRLELPTTLLLHEDLWVDRRDSLRLAEEISKSIGDPLAGLHISELIRFSDYGYWGEAIMAAETVGDAIAIAARQIGRIETGTRITLLREPRTARLRVSFDGHLEANPQQHLEADLLTLRQLLDLAAEPVPAMARLPRSSAPGTDIERLLGPDLAFSGEFAELEFDPDVLHLSLRPTRPAEPRRFRTRTGSSCINDTARAVLRMLRESLGEDGQPTARAVAGQLDMNLRTMQRHLTAWGVSFEEILDQLRYRTALKHLRRNQLRITDIAFQLGYSDAAHFTRAFRRWTGVPPKQAQRLLMDKRDDPSGPLHWEATLPRIGAGFPRIA